MHAGRVLAFAGFASLVFLYLIGFYRALIDDAYITFDYARNLIETGTWGLFPHEVANTTTSMLNTVVTAVTFVFGAHPLAAVVLAALELAATACLLRALSMRLFQNMVFGNVAFLALLVNPLLMSTIGLECILYTLVFVAALLAWQTTSSRALGLILGLGILTRPDAILWMPVFLFSTPGAKDRLRILGFALVPLVPWELYSWIALGSLVPDTLALKTTESWGGYVFVSGPLLYARNYPLEAALSILLLPFAFAGWRRGKSGVWRLQVLLAAFASFYYLMYSLLRTPPYHWYYVPPVVALILLGAIGVTSITSKLGGGGERSPGQNRRHSPCFLSPALFRLCKQGGGRLTRPRFIRIGLHLELTRKSGAILRPWLRKMSRCHWRERLARLRSIPAAEFTIG